MTKHILAFFIMLLGAYLTFGFLVSINTNDNVRLQETKPDSISFNIEKKQIIKPKQQTIEKTKTLIKNQPKTTIPQINSLLNSISFDLPKINIAKNNYTDLVKTLNDNTIMDSTSVDKLPVALNKPKVIFPEDAKKSGVTGYVVLNILIDDSGSVKRVKVLEASPKNIFEKNATEAIKEVKYNPAIYNGNPVQIWVKQKIRFELT